jgi:hypothetical protein
MSDQIKTRPVDPLEILSRVPDERRECVEALNRRLGLLG